MGSLTARRIWTPATGCAFCLRAEGGWVWCRGMCRDLTLMEAANRFAAIKDNPARAALGLAMPVKPVLVPDEPATSAERSTRCRIAGVEHILRSRRRISRGAVKLGQSDERLEASRRALEATQAILNRTPKT